MNKYLLITISVFLIALHIGFQPQEPKQNAYQLQLEAMASSCKDLDECIAINNLIKRGAE